MRLLLCIALCIALTGCRDSGEQGAGITPGDEVDGLVLVRKWEVPADLMKRLLEGPPRQAEKSTEQNDPFVVAGVVGDTFYLPLPDMLEDYYEIPFPSGTSADFSPNRGELVVRNTAVRLAQIEELLQSLDSMQRVVLDERLFRPIGNLVLNGGEFPSGMARRQWHVAPAVMDALFDSMDIKEEHADDPFGNSDQASERVQRTRARERSLSALLNDCGISVPDGASVTYDREAATVTSFNTESNTFYTEIVLLECAISVNPKKNGQNKSR